MIRNSATGEGSRAHIVFLYSFRFVDPVTGRWACAPYRAERCDIERRYAQWEITGKPEIRYVAVAPFGPCRY
jgi:hypothetical protein